MPFLMQSQRDLCLLEAGPLDQHLVHHHLELLRHVLNIVMQFVHLDFRGF